MSRNTEDHRGPSLNTSTQRGTRFPKGMKSSQLGYGEELFLLFMSGIALLFLVVFGLALWLGRGLIGKLIGLVFATGLLSPIWYPVVKTGWESSSWDRTRLEVARICEADLLSLLPSVEVESVLDEVSGLSSSDLQHLLIDVGIKFVEIYVKPNGNLTQNEDYAWSGAAQGKAYAHLQLGSAGSAECYFSKNSDVKYFFTAASPVKPGTCLLVTYLTEPTAVDEIVEIQGTEPKRFSRWTLRNRRTGLERAAVSDAFRQMRYPQSQPGWDRRGDQNSCSRGSSGYGLLLDRMTGTDSSRLQNKQFILDSQILRIEGLPLSYPDLRKKREARAFISLKSQTVPFSGDRSAVRDRFTWQEAYQEALRLGAWVTANKLIQPQAGQVLNISNPGFGGKWGTTGSQLIYATANDPTVKDGRVLLFGLDFKGRHLWSAQVAPLMESSGGARSVFSPERFEITKDSMLIHGIYSSGIGEEQNPLSTIRIPLSELKTLEIEAQKAYQK